MQRLPIRDKKGPAMIIIRFTVASFAMILASCAKIDTATNNHVVKVYNSTDFDVKLKLATVDISSYYTPDTTCTEVEQEKTVASSNIEVFLTSFCRTKVGNPSDSFKTGYPFKLVSIEEDFTLCRWDIVQPGSYFGKDLLMIAVTAEITSIEVACKEGQTRLMIE